MGTGLGQSEIELFLDLRSPRRYFRTLATLPVLGPPQTLYFYNDYVYASAGYLGPLKQGIGVADLEQAYADAMKRELFDPIGMPTTAITDDPTGQSDDVSRSYGYDLRLGEKPDEVVIPYQPVRMVSPAGATATTVNEMARYLITQINGGVTPDGNRLVATDVLAETWKGQTTVSASSSYAMGWLQVTDANGIPYLWHSGSVDGFKADMTRLTEANIRNPRLRQCRGSLVFPQSGPWPRRRAAVRAAGDRCGDAGGHVQPSGRPSSVTSGAP